jgi:hypothetical protein
MNLEIGLEGRYTIPTRYWHHLDDGRVQCDVCPRACRLHEGRRGLCFVRGRVDDLYRLIKRGSPTRMTGVGRSTIGSRDGQQDHREFCRPQAQRGDPALDRWSRPRRDHRRTGRLAEAPYAARESWCWFRGPPTCSRNRHAFGCRRPRPGLVDAPRHDALVDVSASAGCVYAGLGLECSEESPLGA